MNMKALWAVALAAVLSVAVAGCEKQGPLERAGEEVDEAVDTAKRGEESTESKVDDAADEARDAADELQEE